MYVLKELAGAIVCILFVGLFVYLLSSVSAPDATQMVLVYLAIVALIIGFTLLMMGWEPLVHGEGRFPLPIPSAVGIPLGVAAFVVTFVSALGELLLHVKETISPGVALAIAGIILATATILSWRSGPPEEAEAEHGEPAPDTGIQVTASTTEHQAATGR